MIYEKRGGTQFDLYSINADGTGAVTLASSADSVNADGTGTVVLADTISNESYSGSF